MESKWTKTLWENFIYEICLRAKQTKIEFKNMKLKSKTSRNNIYLLNSRLNRIYGIEKTTLQYSQMIVFIIKVFQLRITNFSMGHINWICTKNRSILEQQNKIYHHNRKEYINKIMKIWIISAGIEFDWTLYISIGMEKLKKVIEYWWK